MRRPILPSEVRNEFYAERERQAETQTDPGQIENKFIRVWFKEVQQETDKAVLIFFTIYSDTPRRWFPKSAIRIEGNYLYIPVWLARKKGYHITADMKIYNAPEEIS